MMETSASGSGGLSPVYAEKLEGMRNYGSWKFDIQCHLMHDDLWKYVEETPPVTDEAGQRRDQKAFSKICLMVNKDCKVYVRSCKTAKQAWEALRNAFEDKGINNRCRLLTKLVSLKLNQFNSMGAYVTELLNVAQQLGELGKSIDDELLAALMLAGLPEEYTPMRLALENTNITLTTDYIKTKLLQMSDYKESSASSEPITALTAKKKPFKKNYAKTAKQPKCFICEGAHKMIDCPDNPRKKKDNNKKERAHVATALSMTLPIAREEQWILDSGASSHMSSSRHLLKDFVKHDDIAVCCANGGKVYGKGFGRVESEPLNITFDNVMYVPELHSNLLSVSMITKKNKIVVFSNKGCSIYNEDECEVKGNACVEGKIDKGIYKLMTTPQVATVASTEPYSDVELWHKRLAHLGIRNLKLLKNKLANGVSFSSSSAVLNCEACLLGKQSREPFPKEGATRATEILQLVHSDVCGPMTESFSKFKYFLTFIDDFSRKTFIYFLKYKSEVFEKIKEFKVLAENQTNKKLKVLRTDNGSEFKNKNVVSFLKQNGIMHQYTCTYTPEQNGVAERANRTITEKARCMMQEAGLDSRFWAEAVKTAVYLKNRSPTNKVRDMTPEEAWTGSKVDLQGLKIFGCRAYVHVPDGKRTKWEPKAKETIFVGYSETTKGYRLFDPENNHVYIARDVKFFEHQMYKKTESPKELVYLKFEESNEDSDEVGHDSSDSAERDNHQSDNEQNDEDTLSDTADAEQWASFEGEEEHHNQEEDSTLNEESGNESVQERRYPLRDRKPVQFPDYVTYQAELNDPLTVEEALARPDAGQWKAAIQEELDALKKNKTWILVKREHNQTNNLVDSKWLFRIKKEAGNKTRYKARLVARGFSQRRGVDYIETYSPVVRHSTLRMLIALAVQKGLKCDHMDVKTAFLNGHLAEKVYMRQPPGFEEKGKEDHICLLKRSIYGLKQAPRSWNQRLHKELIDLKFKQSLNEPCVYLRERDKKIIILAIYVDDILLFWNDLQEVKTVKRDLMSKFEMKDLGKAELVLGIKVTQENGWIKIDQGDYIRKVLKTFKMEDCKPASTPMEPGLRLQKPDGENKPNEKIPYRELIGSLMYIAVCTRPDIAQAVNFMSQFNNCYEEAHWIAAKRILRYLKKTTNLGLKYSYVRGKACEIEGFADADHGGNIVDRKSFSGYVFKLSGAAISWQSMKQKTVALSTAEAEYVSLSEATKEAVYLKRFFKELTGIQNTKLCMHTDSQSAMAIALNPVHHHQTKHIDVRYHFVRDTLISDSEIQLKYLETNKMTADILTKSLLKAKFEFCAREMGVI